MKKGDFRYRIIKGLPIGTLVAVKSDGKVKIGWSKRHTGMNGDKTPVEPLAFSKQYAVKTALIRACADLIEFGKKKDDTSTSNAYQIIPSPIRYHLKGFIERSKRWFKTDTIANVNGVPK